MERRRRVRAARKRRLNPRFVILMLALVMLIGGVVGGTVAWLTDTSKEVKNTFTPSDVDIDLAETKTDFKMVPGNTIEKDPKVTVNIGSEASYVFVKVEKSNNFDSFMEYSPAEGWTVLETSEDGLTTVYWRTVGDLTGENAKAQVFSVLSGDKVTVLNTVTKEMMDDLVVDDPDTDDNESTYPTLTFTAYAIQQANVGSTAEGATEADHAAAAWALINSATP